MPRPALAASARPRSSSASRAAASDDSFFCGSRASPGTSLPTSQPDWLISITAISVLS
jgi:hypothetical protein